MNDNALMSVTILGTPIASCAVIRGNIADPGVDHALARFLALVREATGSTLSVLTPDDAIPDGTRRIVVGPSVLDTNEVRTVCAGLGDEGYAVLCDGGNLYLTGNAPRGVIYALYAFLEKVIGWRFLSASARFLKRDRDVTVDETLRLISTPGFEARDCYWYDSIKDADQTNALRLNGTFCRDLSANGGGVRYGGRFVHSLADLAEVPDVVGQQPCLTDEKIFETVRKNVRRILAEDPTVNIISVSQLDSFAHQQGCQCERCRAIDEREGTPMGSLLTFVNRIADDIRDDYPHVYIDTLAYRYTRKAPKTIVPSPNVIIRLCSIECCFAHPIADPTCEQNVAFCRDIEEWSRICQKLFIWDYTTNYAFYLTPFPNFAVLRQNVRFFKEHHVMGMFEQGNYQSKSGELGELRAYLLSNLLWDPYMSEEQYMALMDDFLACYYGAGWQYIRTYIDRICAIAATHHITIYSQPTELIPAINEDGSENPGIYEELCALWDQAYAAAETDAHRAHVEQSRISPDYLHLLVDTSQERQADRDLLLSRYRKYDIRYFGEGGIIPDAPDTTKSPLTWT